MKKIIFILILILTGVSYWFPGYIKKPSFEYFPSYAKGVSLIDDDSLFQVFLTNAQTVGEFLEERKITLNEKDYLFPDKDAILYPGSRIIIKRAKKVKIIADGEEKECLTFKEDVEAAIFESGVPLNDVDIVKPKKKSFAYNNIEIKITRVNVEEKVVKKSIKFKTDVKKDKKLGWRKKKVKQKGEEGIKEITYEIKYHNGKEVSRKLLKQEITKKPVTEIIKQGTKIEFGKIHKGLASWYAYTGGLKAASPWLPMGSFVKVTNKSNKKSVIVEINDRGPFGEGRIIDLDKAAFSKIAPLGAGVVDVKVEEIKN